MNHLKNSTFKGETKGYSIFETNTLTAGLQELASIAMSENCDIRDLKVEHDSLEQRFWISQGRMNNGSIYIWNRSPVEAGFT
jgi:hypothetical protein